MSDTDFDLWLDHLYPTAQTEVIGWEIYQQTAIPAADFWPGLADQIRIGPGGLPRCPLDGSILDHVGTHGHYSPIYELDCVICGFEGVIM